MSELKEKMLLYLVTDRAWSGEEELARQVEKAVKSGVTIVQIREKNLSFEDFVTEAVKVKKVTDKYGIPLIINDRIDVAAAVDAGGVHLGQKDEDIKMARKLLGPGKIIGLSAHNVFEAVNAQKSGADYIGAGAVFGSSTKTDAGPLACETLKNICNAVTVPVVAIGGITRHNICKLSGSGISGVAVISGILGTSDISKAAKELHDLAKKVTCPVTLVEEKI